MKTAILIVSWNGKDYVDACLNSLRRSDAARLGAQVILVDNGSVDGTVAHVQAFFPEVTVLALPENRGFCGGNNVGLEHILEAGYEQVFLLNQDTVVEENFLGPLLETMQNQPQAGQVQALVLQHGAPDIINTAGNPIHILGFGYAGRCGQPRTRFPEYCRGEGLPVASASGAAVLIRVEALRQVGLFDELYFAYDEDVDLSWRLRLAGYTIWLDSRSLIHHHYEYSRNPQKYYFLERNRLITAFKNYQARTLLVLAPVFVGYEVFMLLYAAATGWFRKKLRSYADLWAYRKTIRSQRARVQTLRKITDQQMAEWLTPVLEFEELHHPIISLANAGLRGYWRLMRRWL